MTDHDGMECPHGGDITNDCEGCVYSVNYCYKDGGCVRRGNVQNKSETAQGQ